jgi:murein DD-endopeptidase MepM/ murein hydrolase activator NlpD
MYRPILFLFLYFALLPTAKSQLLISNNKYPLVDFRPPLSISPPALSGSFGELRSNHFHSGIDLRTNQREGYPVYAIADGYISRIRIQSSGFGNALYINHPNGYTSVYGHLQRYNAKLSAKAKTVQYEKKSFDIDEFPAADLIPVYKGEIIAYSGNTGSSGGPHLHFEIRDTKTEATINPQLFGIEVPDQVKPVISAMYAYRLDGQPFSEFTPKIPIPLIGAAGAYRVASPLSLSGEIGFGIVTTDRHTGLSGTNGVYSIMLEIDGRRVYTSALERFSFENSKAINSHIDYPTYLNTKRSIQKSFVDPGNPLQIYTNLENRGRISFNDGLLHDLKYTVTDVRGNTSTITFQVQASATPSTSSPRPLKGILFPYNQVNEFKTDSVFVQIQPGNLYNDLDFVYKAGAQRVARGYSAVHQVHNRLTPLHTGFDLWIKPMAYLGELQSKALIVSTSGASQGGKFEDGFVKAKPRTFGSFYIAVDTLPPTITPVNMSEGKNMRGVGRMTFKIRDNLSGIKSFNGSIDGRWVLMEFDAKTATLSHSFDGTLSNGKHNLALIVVDMKENSRTLTLSFYK